MKRCVFFMVMLISLLFNNDVIGYSYTVIDLGTFDGGGTARPFSLNNSGKIVGNSTYSGTQSAGQPFIYNEGHMQYFGDQPGTARSVNDSGVIVGDIGHPSVGREQAFVYINSSILYLGTFGGKYSCAKSINNINQIVGYASLSSGHEHHAFLYENEVMSDLNVYLQGRNSIAYSINNNGQIVGGAEMQNGPERAFLFQNGVVQDLGTLGGYFSRAHGINDDGLIVGFSYANDNQIGHAFVFLDGIMSPLNMDINTESQAFSVNNANQIVGFYSPERNEESQRAFIYVNGEMLDLNNLIEPSSDWILRCATSINDSGLIVGYGSNAKGDTRAFMLTPVPEPTSLVLFVLGIGVLSSQRRKIK